MTHLLVTMFLMVTATDNVTDTSRIKSRYSRKVLVSTLLGAACIGGTAIFHAKASDAYDEYLSSDDMGSAVASWNKVQQYDNVRNVFAIGAVVFVARAIYYQIKKSAANRSAKLVPVIDLRYAGNSKVLVGLKRDF
jgi:hypothetical protein